MTPTEYLNNIFVYESGSEVTDEYEQQVKWLLNRVNCVTDAYNHVEMALADILENEDIECRSDEDCEHCAALAAIGASRKALEQK